MADIDIKQPAKINRNTAADGDFLWEKDFKVLYENDEKLKNAIQQASQDYTAGDGIDIDPSTKTISVKTGTGIEKTEEGLSVNIKGVGGAKVELQGNTFKVSAYNAEPVINELNGNVDDLQNELDAFEEEVAEKYITSGNEMVPNHQYVYTTSGWADIGGEHATVSYWRPTYNESTGKLSWQMSPSIEAPADALVKGDRGDDGQTPEFQINQNTNFWEWKYKDESESYWRSTNTSATGPQGAKGEQGDRGYTPEITHAVDTANSGIKVTISWPAGSEIPEDNFIIPSGTPGAPGINGTNGTNGTDGKTPQLRVDSTTNRWQVSYNNGTNWADISPATSATGPKGDKGPEPTIGTEILAPTSEHLNGGVRWTIKYPGMSVSAWGDIWNGNDGDATTVNFDTATGHTMSGNGGDSYPYGVNTNVIATQTWVGQQGFITKDVDNLTNYYKKTETSAKEELTTEFANKVNKPDTSLTDKYLVLRTDTNGAVSGWCNFNDKIYSKTESDGRYMQKNTDSTLSGDGTTNNPLGIDTTDMDDDKQYAFTTTGWEEVQGGGSTYTAGEGINIINDIISLSGIQIDTGYTSTLPKLEGNGTINTPLSISAFSYAVDHILDLHDTAITNLVEEIGGLGGTITLKGEDTCVNIGNIMNQSSTKVGDAYIATDSGQVWNKSVNKGDMVVKNTSTISVLTTAPDMSTYAKLTQRTIVEPGLGTTIAHSVNSDGANVYTVNAIPGGEGTTSAYNVNSSDDRFVFNKSIDSQTGVINYSLSADLPKLINVSSMQGITPVPNSYYFVIE